MDNNSKIKKSGNDQVNSIGLMVNSNINYDMGSYLNVGEDDMMTLNSRLTNVKSKVRFEFSYDCMATFVQGKFYVKDGISSEVNFDALRAKIQIERTQKILEKSHEMNKIINGIKIGGMITNYSNVLEIASNFDSNKNNQGDSTNNQDYQPEIDEFGNLIPIKIDYSEGVRIMRLNREGRVGEIF
jgi:hypothetical protein